MFLKVLPVDIAMGRAFLRTAVAETVAQARFELENMLFKLDRDVDYVANLLLYSVILGRENPYGIWGGGLIQGSDIDLVANRIMDGRIGDADAQKTADQLLLQFGLFPRQMWPAEVLRLEQCGTTLYSQAARANQPPLRDQLASMAEDFQPWVTVIRDLQRRESLVIR